MVKIYVNNYETYWLLLHRENKCRELPWPRAKGKLSRIQQHTHGTQPSRTWENKWQLYYNYHNWHLHLYYIPLHLGGLRLLYKCINYFFAVQVRCFSNTLSLLGRDCNRISYTLGWEKVIAFLSMTYIFEWCLWRFLICRKRRRK